MAGMSSAAATSAVPLLSDFLSSVPSQLTTALIHLAPYISLLKRTAVVISWRSSWFESWLVIGGWWALCLLGKSTLRFFLPLVLLVILPFTNRRQNARPSNALAPVTEYALQAIITDLTIIQSLFPQFAPLPAISLSILLRVVILSYIPYLFLTCYLSLSVIFAVVGTVILTWRAPWATILRATVWRSAWFRWTLYAGWARLTGQPLPSRTLSLQPKISSTNPVRSIRFLFTIYENQRWWMGLDWTAALLPGERPSWCSAAQHPVSPPNAFSLPDITTVYLPDGNGRTLKRTATWKWEEPEWRVLVRKSGGGSSRIERPLPAIKEDNSNGSRLLKAAGMFRESGSLGNVSSTPPDKISDEGQPEDVEDGIEEESSTDADGWVYGDNKWEGQGSRGGMGKYTRYRRWTRVAFLSEIVNVVDTDCVGITREPTSSLDAVSPTNILDIPTNVDNPPESPLRQRLKLALAKGATQSVVP